MLKVGVFGVGAVGISRLKAWRNIPGIEIVGFIEPNIAKSRVVKNSYKIPSYTNYQLLLNDCDIADISVPTHLRQEICVPAIKTGNHVFVSNPFSNTVKEAEEIIKLVKESNIIFHVGHVDRFNPAFDSIKNIKIEPQFVETQRLVQYDSSKNVELDVVLDLLIHDILIIQSIVKAGIKNLFAFGVTVFDETPDMVKVTIEFNNGTVAELTASRISSKESSLMKIYQKENCIELDFLNNKSEISILNEKLNEKNFSANTIQNSKERIVKISQTLPHSINNNALQQELHEFLQSIENGHKSLISELEGYQALKIAHEILDKIHSDIFSY